MYSKLSLLAGCTSAWSYGANNGADWASTTGNENCALTNQSPINLKTQGTNPGYTVYSSDDDELTKTYTNQIDQYISTATVDDAGAEVVLQNKNNAHTTQLDLVSSLGTNMFTSKMGEQLWGADTQYNGAQFHLHAGSEHTIDGVRHDLEMHTVHLANDGRVAGSEFFAAAVGIVFSTDKYTADLTPAQQQVIDAFFDGLKWSNDATPDSDGKSAWDVDMVLYGNLMEMVDSNNRWIYKGSVTTPPCDRFVYWNVISTIYPVSQKHLDQFKAQLAPLEGGNLADYGNWREIMPEDDHGVAYIQSSGSSLSSSGSGSSSEGLSEMTAEAVVEDIKKGGNAGLIVAVLILVIIALILLLSTVYLYFSSEKKQEKNQTEFSNIDSSAKKGDQEA